MVNWFERMATGTRGQLLGLLRRSTRSINELADAVGISDNAVRMHVSSLQRDGMVESAGVERTTGGKPAQLYRMTPEAEELFPKAYALVLSELIQVLEEERGEEATTRLLREVGARAAAAHRMEDAELAARVARAAAVLRELGGDVEVARAGEDWEIRGYGCPLSGVVREHAETCRLAESLVGEIAGARAVEQCARGERPRCAFRISATPATPPVARPNGRAGD